MEDSDQSEKSISMGPVGMISHDVDAEDSQYYESVPVTAASSVDSSFASPVKNAIPHAMGLLSLSSIPAVDISITGLAHSLASPEGRFGPDILMSTVNTGNNNPVNICAEDLSISMGPLPPPSITEDCPKPHETSLVANIEKLELKRKLSQISMPKIAESKSIQTEEIHCQKCEQLDICYNQKLIEVATEFQKQYASQFQMAEQHTASLENAQKQINDLMDQLDGADKQIKVFKNYRYIFLKFSQILIFFHYVFRPIELSWNNKLLRESKRGKRRVNSRNSLKLLLPKRKRNVSVPKLVSTN